MHGSPGEIIKGIKRGRSRTGDEKIRHEWQVRRGDEVHQLEPLGRDHQIACRNVPQTARYLVDLEIGGLTGVVASMIGKTPPDLRYWLAVGEVPAFVRFQGAMFLNGPVWRVEMAGVD